MSRFIGGRAVHTFFGPDVVFTVERPGDAPVHGRLRGRHGRIVLQVDDPRVLDLDSHVLRAVADGLSQQGLTLKLSQQGREVATLGAGDGSRWRRLAERSGLGRPATPADSPRRRLALLHRHGATSG